MRKAVLLSIASVTVCAAVAQPPRRQQERQEGNNSAVTLTERAKSQYTAQRTMPADVTWRRDIYRELDLRKEKNAALYYPEEPLGERVNFFTLIFNLILDGKIKAYEYRLDGNESFTENDILQIENLLDKFYIYYEKEGSKYKVLQADIPSGEILKYYIKESNYIDSRTSDYQTRVTAVCPVLIRSDFGTDATQYPMFWLQYDEISPYLGQTPVMTSSYNNTTNMSLDDYFVMQQYDGAIYKTSNLRNMPLAEYCETDSLLEAERQRIEGQLSDIQNSLWGAKEKEGKKSEKAEAATVPPEEKAVTKRETAAREPKAKKEKPAGTEPKSEKSQKASKASGERISVNRR